MLVFSENVGPLKRGREKAEKGRAPPLKVLKVKNVRNVQLIVQLFVYRTWYGGNLKSNVAHLSKRDEEIWLGFGQMGKFGSSFDRLLSYRTQIFNRNFKK